MSENTRGVTVEERIKHVGGRVNEDGTVTFGSPMAAHAMICYVADDTKFSIKQLQHSAASNNDG